MDKGSKSRFYEGCGKEGPILCVFICEFHSTYGPKISCQVPKDFISKEKFESVNVYLIPKPQLIRSIITVTLDDIKIVGYPVRIESQVYPRNAFYYNLCFVCDSWARTVQYDQVVKDFSAFLRQLEEDERFLSNMAETESRVSQLLEQALGDLNKTRISFLKESKRSVRLRVGKQINVEIPLHSVPILLVDLSTSTVCQHLEQNTSSTIDKIIPHIDGVNCVEKISSLTNIDLNSLNICLNHLINDSMVKLVEQYNEGDSYLVTSDIRKLLLDKNLQTDCISRVPVCGAVGSPTLRDILRIYSSFNHGATVKDVCHRFDMSYMKIDCRKLVQFGLIHGLIRKLSKHVSYVAADGDNIGGNLNEETKLIYERMDGKLNLDDVSREIGISRIQLDHLVDTDSSLIALYK